MDWSNYRLIQVHLQLFYGFSNLKVDLNGLYFAIEFNYFYTLDNYSIKFKSPQDIF